MLYFYMDKFLEAIAEHKALGHTLFYNSSGSKQAYQLGVKHISAAEFLGFALLLPNADLHVTKAFTLVDFEKKEITEITQGQRIRPIKLKSL